MRIALVCGHFIPEIGYMEVHFARTFSRKGHRVRVFTSTATPSYIKKLHTKEYAEGVEQPEGYSYEIHRLKPYFSLGQMVRSKALKQAVDDWQPDIAIMMGPGKLWPQPLMVSSKERAYPLHLLIGDNADTFGTSGSFSKRLKTTILRKKFKQPVFVSAARYVDKFFSYTPESADLFAEHLSKGLRQRLHDNTTFISLGFDPETFYFDEQERKLMRQEMHIPGDELLLITATRATPFKKLERIIDAVTELHRQGTKLHYLLVGLMGDDYANQLTDYVAGQPEKELFHLLNFQEHTKLREHYNAADFGIWPSAAITIQEGMGTGLPVLLPDRKYVSHLVQGGNGWYFAKEDLTEKMREACEQLAGNRGEYSNKRNRLAEQNRAAISYPVICRKLIETG